VALSNSKFAYLYYYKGGLWASTPIHHAPASVTSALVRLRRIRHPSFPKIPPRP
jgi:hypothetical protein